MAASSLLLPSPPLFPLPPPLRFSSHLSSLPSAPSPPSARGPYDSAAALKQGKFCIRHKQAAKAKSQSPEEGIEAEEVEGDDQVQVVMAMQSSFNDIVILDTPESRLLLLDSTHNVHSMVNKEGSKWTGSYWDEFAALPPVVSEGPIAIFGLGGGTAAQLMLELWPSLQLEGWEIDEILIHMSRDYLGLKDVEKQTIDGGILNVHIGDVFSPDAAIPGGYAGIIVDLFAEGKVLPQLEQPSTWLELYHRLKPNGRLMVNCGAGDVGVLSANNALPQHGDSSLDDTWKTNATIRALCKAFPGQVNWKKMPKGAGENYLALTGSLPDLATWSASLPSELKESVYQWRPCNIQEI